MQLKCCTQYPSKLWKLSSGPRTGSQFSFQSQRNTKLKNVQTTAQLSSSHTLTKLMLKILHRRLQKYVIQELPYVQAGFRKGKRSRDQIANIHWIITKATELQKIIYFCIIDHTKAIDCVEHNKLENSERDGNIRQPYLPSEKYVCRSRSNSKHWTWKMVPNQEKSM